MSRDRVMKPCLFLVCVCVLSFVFGGCQTTPEPAAPETGEVVPPEPVAEFQPAYYVASIAADEARYPDLFSKNSFAVWVGPEVTVQKQEAAQDDINPQLVEEVRHITDEFVVIECHIESVFSDMSIAYDVTGFRGVEVFLELPDGREMMPVQKVLGQLEEEQRGALKLFRRVNLLVFSRRDLWSGSRTLDAAYPSVQLVLQAHESKFAFEWPGARYADPASLPDERDRMQAIQAGFVEVFGRLRTLAHIFD